MYFLTTIAGNGINGYKDGIGKEAEFYYPFGIVISRDKKDLFVADNGNHCIRRISLVDGTTYTIAGASGMEL